MNFVERGSGSANTTIFNLIDYGSEVGTLNTDFTQSFSGTGPFYYKWAASAFYLSLTNNIP